MSGKQGDAPPPAPPTGDPAPLNERYLDDAIVDGYDEKRYEGAVRGAKSRAWIALVRRTLDRVTDATSIIDIPCGTGYLTEVLHGRFPLTVAADVSPTMVRKARSKVEVPGVVGDIFRLPHRDGAVDCVLNARFMVHFGPEERTRALKEMARVSRRWVVVNYNHRYNIKYLLRRIRTSLGLLDAKKTTRKSSRRELRAEAEAAGLRIVKVFRELPWAPFMTERWMVVFEKAPRG